MPFRLQERTLCITLITLPEGAAREKFDDPQRHGLSHAMKAVDFVVENGRDLILIEVKDPDAAAHHPQHRQSLDAFRDRIASHALANEAVRKFRDTFVYLWAEDRLRQRVVHYYLLIAFETLDAALLLSLQDDMKRMLPAKEAQPASWSRSIVKRIGVFNLKTWNEHLREYPVARGPDCLPENG